MRMSLISRSQRYPTNSVGVNNQLSAVCYKESAFSSRSCRLNFQPISNISSGAQAGALRCVALSAGVCRLSVFSSHLSAGRVIFCPVWVHLITAGGGGGGFGGGRRPPLLQGGPLPQ